MANGTVLSRSLIRLLENFEVVFEKTNANWTDETNAVTKKCKSTMHFSTMQTSTDALFTKSTIILQKLCN